MPRRHESSARRDPSLAEDQDWCGGQLTHGTQVDASTAKGMGSQCYYDARAIKSSALLEIGGLVGILKIECVCHTRFPP